MKQLGTSKIKDTSEIKRLRLKRRNYIRDYLHKASWEIVDLAVENKVSAIVIGDIKILSKAASLSLLSKYQFRD
ncbi:hypothetical protein HSACCH_01068 [Halanaerobium saccharolyticum subsp. saccharolyticum DSM 6643]|uniref:Uncharacterized protein n=1 Tax=Halanaerobium saccharolyticum subsp. saccharolyticum DSM 6643 TaxID=1293054 RepID=M5E0C7_9FIRM|nr:hypothetical protein HSACCH_01068 [Halanaerobium saccharolyticum subsp. saccharolyticum DSM 6643]